LKKFCYHFGYTLRETGQALDRVGCTLQGEFAFREQLNRHRRVTGLYDKRPAIAQDVFIAPNASVIGQVNLAQGASVWYGAVLRGDVNKIYVGEKSTIGNRTVIHCSSSNDGETKIGKNVLVGDGALIHACTLEDACVVESGAIVFDGAVVESSAVVGPGAVVTKGKRVGAGQYWEGNPARFSRDVTPNEKAQILADVEKYYVRAKEHEKEMMKTAYQKDSEKLDRDYFKPTPGAARIDPAENL